MKKKLQDARDGTTSYIAEKHDDGTTSYIVINNVDGTTYRTTKRHVYVDSDEEDEHVPALMFIGV